MGTKCLTVEMGTDAARPHGKLSFHRNARSTWGMRSTLHTSAETSQVTVRMGDDLHTWREGRGEGWVGGVKEQNSESDLVTAPNIFTRHCKKNPQLAIVS